MSTRVPEGVYYDKNKPGPYNAYDRIWVVPGGGPKWVRYCVGHPDGNNVSALPPADFLAKYRPETDDDREAELTAAAECARKRHEGAEADWLRAEDALARFREGRLLK